MIRAVYRSGNIEPTEAVPETWSEGTELLIESTTSETAAALHLWHDDVEAHAHEVLPEDIDELNAALLQADQDAKAWVKREMGLQP